MKRYVEILKKKGSMLRENDVTIDVNMYYYNRFFKFKTNKRRLIRIVLRTISAPKTSYKCLSTITQCMRF